MILIISWSHDPMLFLAIARKNHIYFLYAGIWVYWLYWIIIVQRTGKIKVQLGKKSLQIQIIADSTISIAYNNNIFSTTTETAKS